MLCPFYTFIKLTYGMVALVDPVDWLLYNRPGWKAKKSRGGWYAYRIDLINGHYKYTYLHRLIANTPTGMVCHHRNKNGLDDRRYNLQNMTPQEHEQLSRHLRNARQNHRT